VLLNSLKRTADTILLLNTLKRSADTIKCYWTHSSEAQTK